MPRLRKLLIILGSIAGSLLVAGYALHYFFWRDEVYFERYAGLKLPSSASIVSSVTREYGLFGVDTTKCIQVAADRETIDNWLKQQPLRGKAQWQKGPVTIGVLTEEDGGIPEKVLYSSEIYCALDTDKNLHRGQLLVLDPRANQAWYFVW